MKTEHPAESRQTASAAYSLGTRRVLSIIASEAALPRVIWILVAGQSATLNEAPLRWNTSL